MKGPRRTMVVVILLGLSMTQVAWAHWRGGGRGHFGVDIVVGAPWGWRYYPPPYYDYPPPYYYYYPRPVYVPPPPPTYIEQPPPERERSAPPPQNYWYYCTDSKGYYPTVKECPGGWLKVVPQK